MVEWRRAHVVDIALWVWHKFLVYDSPVGLGTRLQRVVNNGLKRRHLHVLVMVDFIENVESHNTLRL